MTKDLDIRRSLDWGTLAPLRLRARVVAEGAYAGAHRSVRRGSGVEFGGHREYSPGDDLRWLDRRSMLLHDRLLVRQFETETDRGVRLVVDATASMAYRGSRAPGAKLAYASLLASAIARIALLGGDPVGLSLVGGDGGARILPALGGREQFERIVGAFEASSPGGNAHGDGTLLTRALDAATRGARRGAVFVLFSDLLDLSEDALGRIASMASPDQVFEVVQVLDPDEVDFPFEGTVRLRAMEGDAVVETHGPSAREAYLGALESARAAWENTLIPRGGRFLRAMTSEDPVGVVRRIVEKIR